MSQCHWDTYRGVFTYAVLADQTGAVRADTADSITRILVKIVHSNFCHLRWSFIIVRRFSSRRIAYSSKMRSQGANVPLTGTLAEPESGNGKFGLFC